MSLASPYGRGAPEGGGEGIVIFLKKITSPQAITTHFPENQKNSNIFLIALSVTPYGVPALPKGEPSRLCCKLNNNLSHLPLLDILMKIRYHKGKKWGVRDWLTYM